MKKKKIMNYVDFSSNARFFFGNVSSALLIKK